ncbi:MAG: hypothetical protein IPL61_06750 [Myxococcales bacterium]|nr:hypothetical protein [Myxococcales bacterium]
MAHIGGDARAPMRSGTGERMRSFDMTMETSSGNIVQSIEQTSVGGVRRAHDLGEGVRHAVGKARTRLADGAPIEGIRQVTIEGTVPSMRSSGVGPTGVDKVTGERWIATTQLPPVRKYHGNLYDEVATYLAEQPDATLLDVVTLVDRTSGAVLCRWIRNGPTWRTIR